MKINSRRDAMKFFHCLVCLFVLFTARASLAQGNCPTVLVADGVDFSMFKGGAVGSDLAPLDLDEDKDGIPDRPNEPAPDENGAPTLGWTLEDFDASDWEVAPSGFGYGDRLNLIGTVLDDMEELYVTVYLRHTFEIEDLASVSSMALNMDYDDGFVAYVNAREVGRIRIPEAADKKSASPANTMILSFTIILKIDHIIFSQVFSSIVFAIHHQCISNQFMKSIHRNSWIPVFH